MLEKKKKKVSPSDSYSVLKGITADIWSSLEYWNSVFVPTPCGLTLKIQRGGHNVYASEKEAMKMGTISRMLILEK